MDRYIARLTSYVANERISVHGIAPKDDAGLEEFRRLCLASEGGSFAALAPEDVPGEVERVYAQSANRFEVTYRMPEQTGPAAGSIQITSASGCGRAPFVFEGS